MTLLYAPESRAYPEFIGYGYTSCVTCHYNTQGMGSLNDYGRALFAAEISSRAAFDESTTDDQLGEASGFFGTKQLPSWFRPGIKYRGLWFQTNPGSADTLKKYVVMQEDINLAILFDENQKYVLVGNLGYAMRTTNGPYRREVWLSREHYFRWHVSEPLFISVGMLDKVFGIRMIDHTAFSRSKTGLNQYNSTVGTLTHGVVAQWNASWGEITAHAFTGNMFEDASLRQKGVSVMGEYNTGEASRSGASALMSSGVDSNHMLLAVHQRTSLQHGSAVLAEAGYLKDTTKSTGAMKKGYWAYVQSNALLTRGYTFISLAEYYKSSSQTASNPDQFRWGLGFLTFPIPRVEVRLMGVNAREFSLEKGSKDSWQVQAQLHLSI